MAKNKTQFFMTGIISGIVVTAVVVLIGAGAVKLVKSAKKPKRYDATSMIREIKGDSVKVFAASSLDRIFRDGKTLSRPRFSYVVGLHSAQNEYESFQIVISGSKENLKSVWLDIPDLIDEKTGAKIEKKNITSRVVGYVPTKEPYYPVKYIGFWPDPLLPKGKADIDADTTQPFWVTVYVPADTPSGNYKGTVQVKAEDTTLKEIPVSMDVFGFVLPKESRLKTAFDFYGHETPKRYPQGERETEIAYRARISEINGKFTVEMLKYRMNPVLNIDPTSQEELGWVDRLLLYGLNNFSIGKRGGTLGNNWPSDDEGIEGLFDTYRTYGESLKLNRMLQYTYIYTWDEGNIGNPRVAKICSMIHRAYPGLKNMVCYHGFWVPEEHPDWGKDIDIWCFNIDNFDEAKMRKLQDMGMEIWMYISGPSGFGSPNLAIDFDSIDYRIVPWLCWKYDIKGFLYWCVNWWVLADPFKTAVNTKWEQNGNGLLFYPGENGPVASLRAEIFRDGMEDYEYIQLLMGKLREIRTRGLEEKYKKIFDDSVDILKVDDSLAKSMFDFTKDGEVINARRFAIAQKIEELDRLLTAENPKTETENAQ